MADQYIDETTQDASEIDPAESFLNVNTNKRVNSPRLSALARNTRDSSTSKASSEEGLLPVRMTGGSRHYTPAFRLDENNVCAEAIEAVLFDTLEGECVLAEYQQNNFLCSTTQQKLTDILLSRTSKTLTGKHIQKYFIKLTDAIVRLMPNEDPGVYYIPPQSVGNSSKNPKGKLPDKWRNLTYQLRVRGILPKKKTKEQAAKLHELHKALNSKETIQEHIKILQLLREPLSEVIVHWEATFEHRKLRRNTQNRLDNILAEWPIIESNLGPQLVERDFAKMFSFDGLIDKWIAFFDTLYEVKKSVIRDTIGKEYCAMYQRANKSVPEFLAAIQMQLLPYLIPPTAKFKTGSGVVVKPTIYESSEGFIIFCKPGELMTQKLKCRKERYKAWNIPNQPCIVLEGTNPWEIKKCFVHLQNNCWKVNTPLEALNLAFKLYQVFNLRYPPDCEQIWLIVQKIVYKISHPYDKKITSVTSIINTLTIKLRNKRQRVN